MRNYLLKRVQTMRVYKVPWRKPPIPKQVAVICTRLILPAVFPAVKKHAIQRGSERTICLCKCPSRAATGGESHHAYNSYPCPSRIRQTILGCLPKSMMIAVLTHAPAVKNADIQFQRKRGCRPKRLHPLMDYLDLYLSISSRILNSCSCSSGVFAERNS